MAEDIQHVNALDNNNELSQNKQQTPVNGLFQDNLDKPAPER